MLRRATLSLFSAILALACLLATPDGPADAPQLSATASNAQAVRSPFVRGNLTQDIPELAYNQSVDKDHKPDDRVPRVATLIVWPQALLRGGPVHAVRSIHPTHRACAALPRAPPLA